MSWPFPSKLAPPPPPAPTYNYPLPFTTQNLMRIGSCSLWSTVYLYPGPLAERSFRLFVAQQGSKDGTGRLLSLSDTNMKESGRVPAGVAINVGRCQNKVRVCAAASDIEELAQVNGKEDQTEDIRNNGVLRFDFTQTVLDIGLLWMDSVELQVSIPANASFAVQLSFGSDAPRLERSHAVTVCLTGGYERLLEIG